MTMQTPKAAPVNLKEENAAHTFRVLIRDREHFYKMVEWLNTNVGKGSENWTMEGRVLKTIKQGKTVNPKIYIFKADFDPSSALFLSLI
jgi:hypothetical protein